MKKVFYAGLLLLAGLSGCQEAPAPGPADERILLENRDLSLEVVSAAVPNFVQALHFRDALAGVAATGDGKIYQTADVGATWSLRYTNPSANQPWRQILFTSAAVGYVVGGSVGCTGPACDDPRGRIVKTTDGGATWTSILPVRDGEVTSIAANSVGELFVVINGVSGQILKSPDAGASWVPVASLPFQLTKIAFDQQTGFCSGGLGGAGEGGKIVRSRDDGRTWAVAVIVGDYRYLSELAVKAGVGYCVAGYSKVYRTADQGSSWRPTSTTRFSANVVQPLTSSSCLLLGAGTYSGGDFGVFNGSIRQTKDAGATWTESVLPGVSPVNSASFYAPTAGYAVAGNKLIQVTVK